MHRSRLFERIVGLDEATKIRAEIAEKHRRSARLRAAPKLSRIALNQVYLNVTAGDRPLDERED